MENHGRRSSDTSGDVPVDFEVEIEGDNSNGRDSSETLLHQMENHGRRSYDTSGDVPVDFEVEIEGDSCNGRDSSASPSSDVRSSSSSERGKIVHNHSLGLLAARLFDERVPFKKKLKWLTRLATVKDDGTVQFEVPVDITPQNLDLGTGVVYTESNGKEPVEAEDVQDIPPLQIVMLIVGTRGDVQPFVAIGKRLQGNMTIYIFCLPCLLWMTLFPYP